MKILMTGSHGFIAGALLPSIAAQGHKVIRAVRNRTEGARDEEPWDPYTGVLNPGVFEGIDAVIHLGGDSIAEGRWTDAKKKNILASRRIPTRVLANAMAGGAHHPAVFICASAIGYYGDRGNALLTETSSPGTDFLARVCQEWEVATAPAAAVGTRVINLRFGLILSPNGG